jgi:hypothetical protein
MSLINDALKKASQTPAPASPAEIKEPLQLATHKPAPRWPMFVVPPLVAVVFAAGTMLVFRGWQGHRTTVSASERDVEQTNVAAVLAPPPAPVTNFVAEAAPAPTFPTLKLQGIFWRPSRPSAVINGKSLFIGEKVERATVKAIDEESVTVTWNGEERVLTLR